MDALGAMHLYLSWMHSQRLGRDIPFGLWMQRTGSFLGLDNKRPYDLYTDSPHL